MRARRGADEGVRADSELLPPVDVRVTRINRGRLRLVQALIPVSGLLAAVARGLDSLLPLLLLAILASLCVWLFVSSHSRTSVQARALPGQLRLDRIKVWAGEFGQWRWYGKSAVIFELSGNLRVKSRSTAEAEALRILLQSALGDPLRFRPRGSARARRLAAATAFAGIVLMYLAFQLDIKSLWLVAIAMVLGGTAVFGAFSQSVADSASPGHREP